MRLLSLNVALFETNNEKLAKFLSLYNFDIVCFQEVSSSTDPAVNKDFLSKDSIDQATKNLRFSFFSPTWEIKDFHQKNFHQKESFDFDFSGYLKSGKYLKSRFKIIKRDTVFVQNNTNIRITDWSKWVENQTQAVQIVDLQLPDSKKLRILNYHGIWTKEKIGNKDTLKACQIIYHLAKQVHYPVIIAGDFNLFPDTESMGVFQDTFTSLVEVHNIKTTRPKSNELSNLDRNVVDFILISKGIKVKAFEVLDTDVSDHLPLILDFEV